MMIWEDSGDDRYLNTMPRLVIWLNKPLSRYYHDDEYLEGLNNINTIIGINIHSFIIESPDDQVELCSLEYNPVASTILLVLEYMERVYMVICLRITV